MGKRPHTQNEPDNDKAIERREISRQNWERNNKPVIDLLKEGKTSQEVVEALAGSVGLEPVRRVRRRLIETGDLERSRSKASGSEP